MIRNFEIKDLKEVIRIWFDTNVQAHSFINREYWVSNFKSVEENLPKAQLYIYEEDEEIKAFIGLSENYIEGLFVKEKYQNSGIGKKLMDFVKAKKEKLELKVYAKNLKALNFYEKEDFKIKEKQVDDMTKEEEFIMYWER